MSLYNVDTVIKSKSVKDLDNSMKVKIIHVFYTHYICTGNFIIVWNVKAKYQCNNYVSVFRT